MEVSLSLVDEPVEPVSPPVEVSMILMDMICDEYGWDREKLRSVVITDSRVVGFSSLYPEVEVEDNGN